MVYIKTLNEEQLREFMIDMLVNGYNYDYYAKILKNGKIRIYNEKIENSYTLCVGDHYWKEQYREYCRMSQEEYNDTIEDSDKLNESELEDIIDRQYYDKEQFRDYVELARDHIEIDSKLMEIVF